MADLFDRLFPGIVDGDPALKIPVHVFFGQLVDYGDGQQTTRQEIIDKWQLDTDPQAVTDLDVILAAIDAKNAAQKVQFAVILHGILMMTEGDVKYLNKADFAQRLDLLTG